MACLAVRAENLTRKFGETTAVNGISFDIPKGTIFGLVGPDGSGKSTALKMLSTILPPSSGAAVIAGLDLLSQKGLIRENIGYMSEDFTLYQDLSVIENLIFFADVFGVPALQRDKKIKELMTFARLDKFLDRRAGYLSGGMKQKLALACTLIHEPEVLFLDEPTRGVDPLSRREFWRILTDVNQRGVTIVLSTPYMDDAERCHRIAFLYDGKLLRVQNPKDIREGASGALFRLRAEPLHKAGALIKEIESVEEVEVFGNHLRLVLSDAGKIGEVKKKLKDMNIIELRKVPMDLEATFSLLINEALKKNQ